MTIRLQIDGLLRSPVSWAKVNRELARALVDTPGIEVAVQPRRGFQWDREFSLPHDLEDIPETWDDPDVRLVHEFPPNLERHRGEEPLWVLSVYEASRLPPDWAEPLASIPDRVVVPSHHAVDVYRDSGVPAAVLERIPHGFNPDLYHPPTGSSPPAPDDSLRIATVATPHYRKGLDLIEPLDELLEGRDRDWHVHSPYEPDPDDSPFWEDATVLQRLRQRGFTVTTGPRPEPDIARFLREADLCVQPSRSEGFGLVQLEAMASGTAVVTSDWGGHLDFRGPGMMAIAGNRRPAGNCQYHQKNPGAEVFEPDGETLRNRLESLLENPIRLDQLGSRAVETVEDWTWTRSAERLAEKLTHFQGENA